MRCIIWGALRMMHVSFCKRHPVLVAEEADSLSSRQAHLLAGIWSPDHRSDLGPGVERGVGEDGADVLDDRKRDGGGCGACHPTRETNETCGD